MANVINPIGFGISDTATQYRALAFLLVPLFQAYALRILVLESNNCDRLIARLKKNLGRTPLLGCVFTGKSFDAKGD